MPRPYSCSGLARSRGETKKRGAGDLTATGPPASSLPRSSLAVRFLAAFQGGHVVEHELEGHDETPV